MERIRNWLVRQRDRTLVSYSRFGKPGEEVDDRPPPTRITVAPFDENAAEFLFLRYWHVQSAAVAFACFGIAMVIVFFLSSFFEFDWYHHQRGVDLSALLGLFTYLALGVLIHYYVINGIRKQLPHYLLPFIVTYSILCACEAVICLALIYKLFDASDPYPNYHQLSSTTVLSPSTSSEEDAYLQVMPPLSSVLMVTLISLVVQTVMLVVVLKCRLFISLKANHDMEMKVAEKSRDKNPAIQIVLADAADSNPTIIDNNNNNNHNNNNNSNNNDRNPSSPAGDNLINGTVNVV